MVRESSVLEMELTSKKRSPMKANLRMVKEMAKESLPTPK